MGNSSFFKNILQLEAKFVKICRKKGGCVMANKIQLSPKKILNKQFQIDFKGYSATEVDYF